MSIEKISACLLSWKRPKNLQLIVDHLRSHACIDDIVIWNNNPDVVLDIHDANTTIINSTTNLKTYGRFLATYHAEHPHIYTQDDDCFVKDIPQLFQNYCEDPYRIAHGLREDHFHDQRQFDHGIAHVAYLGWGGIFSREWLSVFEFYTDKYGKDALFCSKADRIFSLLLQKKHNVILMPVENLDGSRGPEAAWTQPEFYKESHQAEQRVLALLGKSVPMPESQVHLNGNKFVIMTTPRTGSNYLVEILGKHPSVQCYGELYNYTSMQSTLSMMPREHMTSMEWRNAHPLTFLENVWRQKHGKVKTGFKFFFEQNLLVKEKLCEETSVKKILLRRKNVVRQFVSLRIALGNKVWGVRNPKDRTQSKVSIDCDALKKYANTIQLYYAAARKKMHETGQEYLEITYEDLMGSGQEACLKDICTFLGISSLKEQKSALLKQNPEPLEEIIINFAEVHEALRDTVYESMLHGDEFAYEHAA